MDTIEKRVERGAAWLDANGPVSWWMNPAWNELASVLGCGCAADIGLDSRDGYRRVRLACLDVYQYGFAATREEDGLVVAAWHREVARRRRNHVTLPLSEEPANKPLALVG